MAYWYPRFDADISVPIAGAKAQRQSQVDDDSIERWTMPLTWFRWERNDFSQADVLDIHANWGTAGLDPRLMADATIEFSLGNLSNRPALQTWGQTPQGAPSAVRFAGVMERPARSWTREKRQATLLFHDYTSFFLHEKPFVSKGLPDFTQTLSQAWARICDHVGPTDPTNGNKTISVIGSHLRNEIEFRGNATDARLGDAVTARVRRDRIGASGPTDAWAVFQQCVQMCGLIAFIELDHLVITTATDFYTERTPPRLIMGRNVIELDEERDAKRSTGGIIVVSFDPLTGTVNEAFAPPIGDSSVRKKHLSSKKKKSEDQIVKAESREVFDVPGITDPGRLQALADLIQEVRSRQELAGRVSTGAMVVPTDDESRDFDLLTLRAGDVIKVEVEQDLLREVLQIVTWGTGGGTDARVARLMQAGYDEGPARVLVANLDSYALLGCKFFVRSAVTEGSDEGDEPSFRTEVHYVNRITPVGDANV